VIQALSQRPLAYLHLIEGRGSEIGLTDHLHTTALSNAQLFRSMFKGPLLSAAAYTPTAAAETIAKNQADAIAFGRLFIANPDLVERIAGGFPLNAYDRSTFYGGDERGYTDYKFYDALALSRHAQRIGKSL
jgi:N-ethylmaleimide reductase